MRNQSQPLVGIGVMVYKGEKWLFGKRKSEHGQGEYAPPGGHLEYMEGFEECARREVREETGLEIKNVKFLCLSNTKAYAPRHYTHICLTAEWESGEPKILEPEKTGAWDWYDLDSLPQPLFKTIPIQIEALETGRNFFDT